MPTRNSPVAASPLPGSWHSPRPDLLSLKRGSHPVGMEAARKPWRQSRFLSTWFVGGIFAVAVTLAACGSSGTSGSRTTTARSSTAPATTSTNYNAQGAWLGQVVTGDVGRVCGYLTTARYAAWSVHTSGMTCAAAARLIDAYLAHALPPGWKAAFRRDKYPSGGPQGSRAVIGMFELGRSSSPTIGVRAGLSAGVRAAPPPLILKGGPYEVHFGCHTRSSICR